MKIVEGICQVDGVNSNVYLVEDGDKLILIDTREKCISIPDHRIGGYLTFNFKNLNFRSQTSHSLALV